jgi:gluconokinase
MVIVVTGAAGAGQTTIGRALAAELGSRFVDADDLHPPGNVEKMRLGQPLTDADRAAWLTALHDIIARAVDRREPLVLACSALERRYRHALRGTLRSVRFVYLKAEEATRRARLTTRAGHFAGPGLLASQLADLEEPADALAVEAVWPPERILGAIRHEFGV